MTDTGKHQNSRFDDSSADKGSIQAYWGDLALKTLPFLSPSQLWANWLVEPYLGLPFGTYLNSAPARRPRALTGLLDSSQVSLWYRMNILRTLGIEQRTDEQMDCLLFSKLPYDLRVIIYEMVLGGMVLHLSAQSPRSRILHHICQTPEKVREEGSHHICSGYSTKCPSSAPRETYPQASGLLPLLASCRRIYSEAVHVLYSTNTFEFTQNFAAFTFLKVMLPPQRLASLRNFRLHMRIPRHPATNKRAMRDWQNLWAFFANETTGLRGLYIELQMLQPMEEQIEATADEESVEWMCPIFGMAVDAHCKRGCLLELETRRSRHEPAKIFQNIADDHASANHGQLMLMACAALHKRIRLSLAPSD